jgi:hypothetical protein
MQKYGFPTILVPFSVVTHSCSSVHFYTKSKSSMQAESSMCQPSTAETMAQQESRLLVLACVFFQLSASCSQCTQGQDAVPCQLFLPGKNHYSPNVSSMLINFM